MKLTKESKLLIHYLNLNTERVVFDLHKNTVTILEGLYHDILTAYNFIIAEKKNSKNFYNLSHEIIHTEKQIPKPKNFNYDSFPLKIREHINEMSFYKLMYDFSLFERQIKIIFVTENNIEHQISTFNKYVDSILLWLFILNEYSSKYCSKNITIYLYFTSHEKHVPKTNTEVLDQINVNSAFTTTCQVDSEIVIFRKEEWFKVLIHETFHNFGLDFSDSNTSCKNEILQIFPVNSEVNLYESYTECWAEIINAALCSFYTIKNKNVNHFIKEFQVYILYEIKYSFFQLVKILDFMGLQYEDLYSKSEYSKITRDTLYKENTNVLSYYVIKTVLINNFQGFLSWCNKHNFSIMQFKKTPANQIEFCKFIKRNYKSKSMINNVNAIEQLFQNKKVNKGYIMTNLRMTVCELS